MQSERVGFVSAVMREVKFKLVVCVGPDSYGAVVGASGDHLLLNAHVETKNGFAMKT
jgi:hypothetical protein